MFVTTFNELSTLDFVTLILRCFWSTIHSRGWNAEPPNGPGFCPAWNKLHMEMTEWTHSFGSNIITVIVNKMTNDLYLFENSPKWSNATDCT